MKARVYLAFLCACAAFPLAADTTAIGNWIPSPGGVDFRVGGAGFAFSPTVDVLVTSLGYDGNLAQTGDWPNATVNLLDDSGLLIVSALVTTNSEVRQGSHYVSHFEPITPTLLAAEQTYYLQAMTGGFWTGWVAGDGLFEVAGELTYLGAAYETNSTGVFPGSTEPADVLPVGGNFTFTVVPEPSSLYLSLVGVMFLFRARLRS